MSKFLVTFPGKFGDILWSLPTVRAISEMVGEKVDFATMPQYESIWGLLSMQPYIDKIIPVKDWYLLHSNHGDQPWEPPKWVETGYTQCWHLGYRAHPGLSDRAMPLVDYIAWKQGIKLHPPVAPFLDYSVTTHQSNYPPVVTYAFNTQYEKEKKQFLTELTSNKVSIPDWFAFVDVSLFPWDVAVRWIAGSIAFVGCRSANFVLAHGVGQKVICFEPHPARTATGHLGQVFGFPYGWEYDLPYQNTHASVELTLGVLHKIKEEKANAVA